MRELCYRNNSNSLFKKYAALVTWFTNTKEGRQYIEHEHGGLYIPNQKLALLLPNGFRILRDIKFDKKGEVREAIFETTVTTKAVYSKALYAALAQFDLIAPYVKDSSQAKKIFTYLLGFKSYKTSTPDLLRSIMFTTTTVYPDPDVESTSVDGLLARDGVNEAFSTIRNGAGTSANDTIDDNQNVSIIATATTDQYSALFRSAYLFDASSIADSEVVSAATMSIYGSNTSAVLDNLGSNGAIGIVKTVPASNVALVSSDFNIASWTMTRRNSADISFASWNTTGYNDFALNATGIADVSVSGITKLGAANAYDIGNSAPTWSSGAHAEVRAFYADNTGTTKDPKLVITSSATTAGSAFLLNFI